MMGDWVGAAATLLLGSTCPGCEKPGAGLCDLCAGQVKDPPLGWVRSPALSAPVARCGVFSGVWRRCLIAYKEERAWWLSGMLGDALALAVGEVWRSAPNPTSIVLVPVPSQASSVRARGWDTTAALARSAAAALSSVGLPVSVEPVLRHVRRVADQSSLGEGQRGTNMAGALRARRTVRGAPIVIDDLVTTGSSLAEAGRALAASGQIPLGYAVVAATPRRDGRHHDWDEAV